MSETINETNFNLPGQIGFERGKSADNYTIQNEDGLFYVSVRTDRISVFDQVMYETIPHKGQVLNEMSAQLMRASGHVATNWLLDVPDPNVSIGIKAEPVLVEMIPRGYLLGSLWKAYDQEGLREINGHKLPDGMRKFDAFEDPILTPTTKAKTGHDQPITRQEIIESELASTEEYDLMAEYTMGLFFHGQRAAMERGRLLADTKYEFGRIDDGLLVVIDEVNTPDSSRYYPLGWFEDYLERKRTDEPEEERKEFVRAYAQAHGFSGQAGQEMPHMPPEFVTEVSNKYIGLYEAMLGKSFEPADSPARLEEMRDNIVASLGRLSI